MIRNNFKDISGQVMVEAMVAMSIILIGLLGVFVLSSTSISLNRAAADRYVAINLAGEGIELVKNLIDRNIMKDENTPWNSVPGFVSGVAEYEIDYNDSGVKTNANRVLMFSKSGSGFYAYNDGDLDLNIYQDTTQQFKRLIKIENLSAEHMKVTSTVFWKYKNTDYDFSVEDHFYNFKSSYYKYNLNLRLR